MVVSMFVLSFYVRKHLVVNAKMMSIPQGDTHKPKGGATKECVYVRFRWQPPSNDNDDVRFRWQPPSNDNDVKAVGERELKLVL